MLGAREMKVGKIFRYFKDKIKTGTSVPSNIKLKCKSKCSIKKKEMQLEKYLSSSVVTSNISEIP